MEREEKANVLHVGPEWSSLSASRHLFSQCQGHVLIGLRTVVRSALAKTWVGAVSSSGARSSLRPAAVGGAEDPLPLAQILLPCSSRAPSLAFPSHPHAQGLATPRAVLGGCELDPQGTGQSLWLRSEGSSGQAEFSCQVFQSGFVLESNRTSTHPCCKEV